MKIQYGLFFIVMLGASISVGAQISPPPGAGDKSLEDRNIKSRSIELERISRDSKKTDNANQPQGQPVPAPKFEEVKQDFESLQHLQSELVNEYTMKGKIDYVKMSAAADQMRKSGLRLEANLFPPEDTKKKKHAKDPEVKIEPTPLPSGIKMLIVEMDNMLSAFVGNSMFTNLQVVNLVESAKAHLELQRLIQLSVALKTETDKSPK